MYSVVSPKLYGADPQLPGSKLKPQETHACIRCVLLYAGPPCASHFSPFTSQIVCLGTGPHNCTPSQNAFILLSSGERFPVSLDTLQQRAQCLAASNQTRNLSIMPRLLNTVMQWCQSFYITGHITQVGQMGGKTSS